MSESAFSGCSHLTSLSIPNSVTSIGNYAFKNCTSLKELTLEDGTETLSLGYNSSDKGLFYDCPLESLYLGRNLSYKTGASYGYSPFYHQTKLTNLTIGSSVTSISNYTFYMCLSLKELTIVDGTETLSLGYNPFSSSDGGDGLFYDCHIESLYLGRNLSYKTGTQYGSPFCYQHGLTNLTIGNLVTSIGNHAFYDCSALTSLIIPNSVTSIGESAFSGCSSLTEIIIPNSVTSISPYTFRGCTSLTSITIPNTVTSIEKYSFYSCSALTSIIIGNSVTSMGESAFSGCSHLTYISIPNSVTSIGESAFSGCSSLTEIIIPNSVTSISESTFSSCSALTSISIPNSITSIGEAAFRGCSALTSLTIPNSVTDIANNAFNDCASLKELIIANDPETLSLGYNYESTKGLFFDCPLESLYLGRDLSYKTGTSYGYSPFYHQTKLTSLTIENSVTSIGESAFSGCTALTSLSIPNSVTSIGSSAFYGCSALTSLTI
ncbi:MAG: leucine-rich repeat domain-containing protein, partial [Paramuribaculum sp.]|nr:leucine-rich repeat domain-containing protein [Paramuribaculum sp.]